MPYLVDGNNVMGQSPGWHRGKPAARRMLLEELAQFAAKHRATILVVFDGAPERHFPDGSRYKGVTIYYSERGSNADERIKQMVEATRQRRTTRVVTSDRALAAYVRRCGAQVLASGEFRRLMASSIEEGDDNSTTNDHLQPDPRQFAEWMRYFGVDPEDGN